MPYLHYWRSKLRKKSCVPVADEAVPLELVDEAVEFSWSECLEESQWQGGRLLARPPLVSA